MSFLGKLFGGSTPKVAPSPAPPPPRIGDAAGWADSMNSRYKLKKRKGVQDSILSSGLGDVGSAMPTRGPGRAKTLLG